ncbi:MAG TPA: prolipoprotein diacylglyceryl transferase [Longimicrobiaceae bacterium]|nr:prolipoprotein diacylglyceryl transferase [Longimicrobiaceae bacterium]
MYPVLIEIGGLKITSFGVMVALGIITGAWIGARELRRRGMDGDLAWDLAGFGAVFGILGAKLYYMILHWDLTLADPGRALFSRAGLVWYGAFIAGTLACIWRLKRLKVSVLRVGDALAPGMALGYGVGRIGCFLVGDDWGSPTTLPWGVKFPIGAPPSTAGNLRAFGEEVPASIPDTEVLAVHPTQLYETGMSLIVFFILWRLRPRLATTGMLFYLWLALAGVERFIVEIFRAKDDRFLGVFSVAQLISVGLVLIGAWGMSHVARRAHAQTTPNPAAA